MINEKEQTQIAFTTNKNTVNSSKDIIDNSKTTPQDRKYNSPLMSNTKKKISTTSTSSYQNYKSKVPSKLFMSTNSSFINEKIKLSTYTQKEKKIYSFKVEAMRKRITALKKQQEEIDKRRQYYERKEIEANQIKEEKEMLRKQIEIEDKKKEKEVETKKIKAKGVKKKIWSTIAQHDKEIKQKKQARYTIAKKERTIIDSKVKDFNQNIKIENKKKYAKAKITEQNVKEEEKKRLLEKEEDIKQF